MVPLDDKGIFISGRVVMGGRAADGKLNEGEDEEGSLKSIGSMIKIYPHKKDFATIIALVWNVSCMSQKSPVTFATLMLVFPQYEFINI